MELKEFMQKFSPIGDEEFISEDGSKTRGFNIKNFPKALQNYTDVICKLQRDICAEQMTHYYPHDGKLFEALTHTNQPSMEDILNGTEN